MKTADLKKQDSMIETKKLDFINKIKKLNEESSITTEALKKKIESVMAVLSKFTILYIPDNKKWGTRASTENYLLLDNMRKNLYAIFYDLHTSKAELRLEEFRLKIDPLLSELENLKLDSP